MSKVISFFSSPTQPTETQRQTIEQMELAERLDRELKLAIDRLAQAIHHLPDRAETHSPTTTTPEVSHTGFYGL